MKFVIEQSKIRYAMYGSIQIKKLNKNHRNNLKNQCQLSSMPIFRMPVVLHANYPHANCPHANSPNANCPSTVYIYIYICSSDYDNRNAIMFSSIFENYLLTLYLLKVVCFKTLLRLIIMFVE